jgi:hypothetical protein
VGQPRALLFLLFRRTIVSDVVQGIIADDG